MALLEQATAVLIEHAAGIFHQRLQHDPQMTQWRVQVVGSDGGEALKILGRARELRPDVLGLALHALAFGDIPDEANDNRFAVRARQGGQYLHVDDGTVGMANPLFDQRVVAQEDGPPKGVYRLAVGNDLNFGISRQKTTIV